MFFFYTYLHIPLFVFTIKPFYADNFFCFIISRYPFKKMCILFRNTVLYFVYVDKFKCKHVTTGMWVCDWVGRLEKLWLMLLIYVLQAKMSLSGWVCVVTGASRGIGRGIALQLSEAGATVYITGRQEKTLKQTAAEVKFKAFLCLCPYNVFFLTFFFFSFMQVTERGGKCLPVICDSTKGEEIKALFDRIKEEQDGRLDILVNNAYAGVHVCISISCYITEKKTHQRKGSKDSNIMP